MKYKRLFIVGILSFFFSVGVMAFEGYNANVTLGAQVDSTQLKRGLKEVKLGESELKDSNYEKAKLHFVNALGIFTQLNERVLMADMYKQIAWMDRYNNENQLEVIEYYKKAAEIFLEEGCNVDHLEALSELRKLYLKNGEMEKYAEISADINQKISSWPPTPKIYSFLGKEKMNEKDDRGAVDYFKKAVELYEKEETIEDVESFFSDCTNLYTSQYFCGQFEDAIATIDKLNDFEMKLKGTIPLYTNSVRVSYKCTLLARLGKLEEAYKLANETRAQFSEDTPNGVKVRVLYTLYVIAFEAGDYERALKFLQEEDEVLATEHPETYWERLDAMLVMANLNSRLGNHSEAVRLIRHMIDVKQEVYKQSLSEYKNDIYYLANLEAFSGVAGNVEHLQDAKKHYSEYTHLEAEDIKQQAPWMTSDQRLKMWEKAQAKMAQATGFASRLGAFNEQMDIDAYNAHLLTTGLLLKTEKTMNDAIELYGSEDDKKLLGSLNEKRNNYAEIQREGDVAKMAECQIEIQNIENKLCKSVAKMPGASSLLDAEYADIHKALKPGEVLIDFAQSGTRLHAYIIRPEWEYPQLVRLCNDADIYAVSESLDANIYRQEQSDQIRALLIDSVLTYVKPTDCIYYVPTGVIHGIALENLLGKDGKALSETYTNMKRLSLANNLINNREKLSPKTATIYGGLDYGDYAVATNTADSEKKYVSPDGGERGIGDRFEKLTFAPYEIKNITSTLKKKHVKTDCLQENEGTEESFMALDGKSPDIIHLSTHGYYLSPERARSVSGLAGYTDAMRLSGLVMSGGNAGWLGVPTKNGEMNGLLTAEDISKLDLSQTKLVVLSACKTASGKTSPEGIFGLQRAFKKAGAGSLVMTLWEVNDKATAEFMSYFYEELAKNGWNRHKAFTNARESLKKLYPDDPYFWAGFVLVD